MTIERDVSILLSDAALAADLAVPDEPHGAVIFVHGSGSSRRSSRNRAVAKALQRRGLATLLFDLLSVQEDQEYENRFDIPLLTRRLTAVTQWFGRQESVAGLPVGYFGASTGAAAALNAAAELGERIAAVVSRGGRPDLAMENLPAVRAPTLLIVGGDDVEVLGLNRKALAALACEKELAIVPGATHLFEEPGALEEVARLAGGWFSSHCRTTAAA